MKVILKPVSHPQIGEISIADDLFAIGRNEEPFASGLGDAAARLSRRHARIFQEDGKVFIADLGSLNGTCINDQPLKNGAAVLQNNDLVTFGNEVSFRVELQRELPKTMLRESQVRLTLVPVDAASGLESIAVERFPFLIARIDSAFEQYKERFPEALRQLSRRHAVITQKGDQVYIEDLESFNGTYVDGQRLDERARPLADGNTIMFGTQHFAYKAHVETPRDQQQTRLAGTGTVMAGPSETVGAIAPPTGDRESQTGNRTRFVSSADSFISVFCAENNQEAEAAADKKDIESTAKVQQLKPKSSIRQFWRAFTGENRISRVAIWAIVGILVAAAAAIGGSYLLGMDRSEIKSLLDDRKYSESAAAANRYLERHPDDPKATAWAQEAVTMAVVPAWMQLIEQGRFDDAAEYLRKQSAAYRYIPDAAQMFDTLSLAGKVQAHMVARGGATAPIKLFRDEDEIQALVTQWDGDKLRRQQMMDQIMTREPAFESVHSQVFAAIRTLRSDNALYVKAIAEFKSSLAAALRKDDQAVIRRKINDFAADFPRVGGVDELKEDLARYSELTKLAQQKELLALVRQTQTTKFSTPVFAEHVDAWLARSLPPTDIIARHAQAADAWREGKHQEAIAILQSLTDGPWGDVATRQITRYQKIEADYTSLLAARGTPGYSEQLLVVWATLRPGEDDHIIRALEPDFVTRRDEVLPRLDESLGRIRTSWTEYENAGGIPGMVRVEERVTERFTSQAKRLTSAYQQVTSGARTYQLLQVTPSAEWQTLQQKIVNEVERQRRWLQDLSIVLEPGLLRAKLALLPDSPEQSLWVRSTTDQRKD
jgi:pSer/pThr/pTyr-binding forkhead associated (FHA) protein